MAKQKPAGPAKPTASAATIAAPKPANRPIVPQAALAEPNPARDRMILIVLTLLTAIGYFAYSNASPGFYQQDEAGHFLSMLDFWDDPKAILGNWAKWGYKLIYVVPALGGLWLVKLLNCLFCASSALLVAMSLKEKGSRLWLVGFFLLALQPLWVSLAFRNYSEIPTAFLLALAYYLHTRSKPLLSMLCISYICTIRQEFYPIMAMYGLNLLYRRQWVAALAGALFPLLQNLYGWYFYDDPIYLYTQVFGQANAIKDAYPRQGFDHYFLLSMVIFGPVAVTLFVQYLGWSFITRRMPDWFIVVPVVVFFLLQCMFNWQEVAIGPSTGGNLRYMLVISPLVAIGAALALEETVDNPKRFTSLIYLGILLLLTGLYLGYKSDLLKLLDDPNDQAGVKTDNLPVVLVMLTAAILIIPTSWQVRKIAMIALLAFTVLVEVRPIKMSEEDQTMKDLASWFKKNEANYKGKPMFINHVMLYYFLERTKSDFTPQPQLLIGEEILKKAPKGTAIFWDSHFSYRPKLNPKSLNYDYFTQRPQEYELKNEIVAPSQGFGVFIFEKK